MEEYEFFLIKRSEILFEILKEWRGVICRNDGVPMQMLPIAMFCNADGERRYKVNADLCPSYADCLEQQIWGASGEPDKSQGTDHANDAAGYFIHREYPIKRPTAGTRRIRGLT